MILQVASGSAEDGFWAAVLVDVLVTKTGVRVLIIVREVKTVLDERRSNEGVVANAVATHPRIEEREREKEEQEEHALGLAEKLGTCRAQFLLQQNVESADCSV